MFKKSMLIFIAIVILMSATPVFALGGTLSTWAKPEVEQAIADGYVPTSIQGDYQQPITRLDFASLFVNMVFKWGEKHPDGRYGTRAEFLNSVTATDWKFTDVNSDDAKLAYMLGFVHGTSATTFTPHKPITRQEAAVMLVNCFQTARLFEFNLPKGEFKDLDTAAPWAKESMYVAYALDLFKGTKAAVRNAYGDPIEGAELSPLGNFTREQAIVIASRLFASDNVPLMIKGIVPFTVESNKIKWEVTTDSVRAVKFVGSDKYYSATLINYDRRLGTMKYKDTASPEAKLASEQGQGMIGNGWFNQILFDRAVVEKHSVFNLGWADYEIFNPDYIFEYRIKDNAPRTFSHYGGSKMLPTICEVIE